MPPFGPSSCTQSKRISPAGSLGRIFGRKMSPSTVRPFLGVLDEVLPVFIGHGDTELRKMLAEVG